MRVISIIMKELRYRALLAQLNMAYNIATKHDVSDILLQPVKNPWLNSNHQ